MDHKLHTINLPLPLRMGSVNCYLIETSQGFVLVDTGGLKNRAELVAALERIGCRPGSLQLIVITHGDFDHTGNAAYLRQAFGGVIGMHADDAGMAEGGDMFVNRKKPNVIIRKVIPFFTGFGEAEKFTPDLLFSDEDELTAYGIEARAISIPGHSKGSLGVLTGEGDLFCGDLLANTDKPALNSLMDDPLAGNASLEKLESLGVRTVYPGHGQPFRLQDVFQNQA